MEGNTDAILAVVLLLIAAALFLAEILIPSGGLLGLLAAGALIGSLFLLFSVNSTLGWLGILVSIIAIPVLFIVGMKLFPETPIGRRLILNNPPREGDGTSTADETTHRPAADDRGKALTDLRPVGTCLIDNHRYDCMATGGVIRAGSPIRVVKVDGMQIKVREDDAA